MKVHVYLANNIVHDRVLMAFAEGCPEDCSVLPVSDYRPSDVAVVFGVFKPNIPVSYARGHVIAEQAKARKLTVVLETGYIRRGDNEDNYYAAGIGGLNGRADFRNQFSPADRWHLLEEKGVHCHPWWRGGKKILVAGQVPWDASVAHSDHVQWIKDTLFKLRDGTREVVFRPHPQAPVPDFAEVGYSRGVVAWAEYKACVTYNSNLGVEAALNGVPVFVDDIGSMALQVANRKLSNLDNPVMPDRTQWLRNLAYTQWTPQEMREGQAWKHLFR